MTRNQIALAEHREQRRSNHAKEIEAHRSNVTQESIRRQEVMNNYLLGYGNLEELKRSNIARESETSRSNIARERESQRHNVAVETETRRSNVASLDELSRHNIVTESIGRQQIGLGYAQLGELKRSNLANEAERNRANLAQESIRLAGHQETVRHNEMIESIQSKANDLAEARNSNEFNIAKARLEADLAIAKANLDAKTYATLIQSLGGIVGNLLK